MDSLILVKMKSKKILINNKHNKYNKHNNNKLKM
jgi:hypothetical protein